MILIFSDEYVKTPSELFTVGQVMKCRILSVDAPNQKMRASFKLRGKSLASSSDSIEKLEKVVVGTITSGTVTAVLPEGLMINLSQYEVEGFLPKMHLSDNLDHIDKMLKLVTEGQVLPEILVLSKDAHRGQLQLSLKPWLLDSTKTGLVETIQDLKAGMILPGFVRNVTEKACFISFVGNLIGMSTLHNLSDMFVANAMDNFVIGQSVIAQISKVDTNQMRIFLNLKDSVLSGSAKLKDFEHLRLTTFMEERKKIRDSSIKAKDLQYCLSWSSIYPISGYTEGTVKSIMPYGTILEMKSGGSGLITHYGKAAYKQGDLISGQILDIDISKKIVDLKFVDSNKNSVVPNSDKGNVSKVCRSI